MSWMNSASAGGGHLVLSDHCELYDAWELRGRLGQDRRQVVPTSNPPLQGCRRSGSGRTIPRPSMTLEEKRIK